MSLIQTDARPYCGKGIHCVSADQELYVYWAILLGHLMKPLTYPEECGERSSSIIANIVNLQYSSNYTLHVKTNRRSELPIRCFCI